AGYVGEADAGLFEHRAIAQHAGAATAAQGRAGIVGVALPGILDKAGAAVGGFDRGADAVLQAGEVVADIVESVHAAILGGAGVRGVALDQARGAPDARHACRRASSRRTSSPASRR